jgi:hypothetical protein
MKPSMPEPEYGGNRQAKDYRNRELVPKYGEATVIRAEVVALMEIMFVSGVIKPAEYAEMVGRICYKIDQRRRAEAGIQGD